MKTRPVDGFVISEAPACVPIGRERLRTALSGMALFFLFGFASFLVHGVIGLLDAGLGLRKEVEDAVEMDPGELDDGMLAVHKLCEPDHSFSSCCAW